MNATDLKKTIDALSAEERFFAAAYLRHLSRVDDLPYRARLGERMRRMDGGKKFTWEQVLRIHDAMESEGL
ncbi:MAG: hypothetical protein ACYDH9_24300 [Limisphaerales bacterium]